MRARVSGRGGSSGAAGAGPKVERALEIFTAACKAGSAQACAYEALQLMDTPSGARVARRRRSLLRARQRRRLREPGVSCTRPASSSRRTTAAPPRSTRRPATSAIRRAATTSGLMADERSRRPARSPAPPRSTRRPARSAARPAARTSALSTRRARASRWTSRRPSRSISAAATVRLPALEPRRLRQRRPRLPRRHRRREGRGPRRRDLPRGLRPQARSRRHPRRRERRARLLAPRRPSTSPATASRRTSRRGRISRSSGASAATRSAASTRRLYSAGGPTDPAETAPILDLACKAGDGEGCFDLGVAYEKGTGVAVDRKQSTALYPQGLPDGLRAGVREEEGLSAATSSPPSPRRPRRPASRTTVWQRGDGPSSSCHPSRRRRSGSRTR